MSSTRSRRSARRLRYSRDCGHSRGGKGLSAELVTEREPPRHVPNVERVLRERVKRLEETLGPRTKPGNEPLAERGRAALRELLGKIRIIEEGEHVFAEFDLGRAVLSQSINRYAQESLPR